MPDNVKEFPSLENNAELERTQCDPDRDGTRHADRCNVVHTRVGSVWELDKPYVRKVYINKAASLQGVEKIELFYKGQTEPFLVRDITPGTAGELFKDDLTGQYIRTRVTTKGVGSGKSQFYIHVEWFS